MPFKCPSCGEINRDDALMCSLCQALFKKAAPRHPPAVTGHPAWPQVQRNLDAVRAAIGAEHWDDARRSMHEALSALPRAAATALVVSLGRQWAAETSDPRAILILILPSAREGGRLATILCKC